jgi:peptidyl-prolyl cis-trans isomerase D
MAVIGKIRQRSWILVGFIALALFIFVIEEAFKSSNGGGGSSKNNVGKIDGTTISGKEFGSQVTFYEDGIKMINPTFQLNDQSRAQIQEEVWNNMAAEQLLGSAYKSLGLEVSTAELADLEWGNNPHPLAQNLLRRIAEAKPDIVNRETGQLNQAKVKEFINGIDQFDKTNKTNFKEFVAHVEKLITDDRIKQKYTALVAQSFYMPTFMAKEVLNADRSAKASVVAVPYTSLPDDKYKVTDGDIQSYIDENKAKFEQQASRVIDAVTFDIFPSSNDTAAALEKINALRTDYLTTLPKDSAFIARNSAQANNLGYYSKDEVLQQTKRNADTLFNLPVGTLTNVYKEGSYYMFTKIIDRRTAPDTVRAAHILLSEGKGSDDEKKAANALADSLIRVVSSGVKNFGQVAAENSKDENSKAKGGDLNYFTRGQMVKEFNDKVFYEMQPGQISKVETQYGLHIILLIEAKSPKTVTKFADFVVELRPSDETIKLAYDKASTFQQQNTTADKFDKAAKTENLRKDIVLTPNMVDVPGIGSARDLVQWAFQQEKTDQIYFEDKNEDRYVVAKLKRISEKGVAKAEDVRDEVTSIIRNQKKGKDLVEQLNKAAAGTTDLAAIAAKVKDASVLDTIDAQFSKAMIQGLGNEPKLIGTIFGTPAGKIAKAVAGERFAFIVQTKSADEKGPDVGMDISMIKKIMESRYTGRLNFQTIFESILKKADVKDERFKLY